MTTLRSDGSGALGVQPQPVQQQPVQQTVQQNLATMQPHADLMTLPSQQQQNVVDASQLEEANSKVETLQKKLTLAEQEKLRIEKVGIILEFVLTIECWVDMQLADD